MWWCLSCPWRRRPARGLVGPGDGPRCPALEGVLGVRPDGGWSTAAPRGARGGSFNVAMLDPTSAALVFIAFWGVLVLWGGVCFVLGGVFALRGCLCFPRVSAKKKYGIILRRHTTPKQRGIGEFPLRYGVGHGRPDEEEEKKNFAIKNRPRRAFGKRPPAPTTPPVEVQFFRNNLFCGNFVLQKS